LPTMERVMLAECTTIGLGGPAARFTEAGSERELTGAVRAADQAGEPLLVLGGGSNLVVADDGFPGTVVRVATSGVSEVPAGDDVLVTAAAGEDWDALVARCVAEGLAGLECLSGIPGQVGATPIQNVGAYGQEVAQTITSIRSYDRCLGSVTAIAAADCGFGYRSSAFKHGTGVAAAPVPRRSRRRSGGASECAVGPDTSVTGRMVVLGVTFRLRRNRLSGPIRYAELARALGTGEGGRVPLAEARATVLELRRAKGMVLDPADPDTRSAGSFFMNPVLEPEQFARLERVVAERSPGASVPCFPAGDGRVKVPAGWLIEQAGFAKGYQGPGGRSGTRAARISAKHTLALVNPGGASTDSLIALARLVRGRVRERYGIELVSEPTLVGVAF
jgi:UDP-N-acetylmuramate dehydrogenase